MDVNIFNAFSVVACLLVCLLVQHLLTFLSSQSMALLADRIRSVPMSDLCVLACVSENIHQLRCILCYLFFCCALARRAAPIGVGSVARPSVGSFVANSCKIELSNETERK